MGIVRHPQMPSSFAPVDRAETLTDAVYAQIHQAIVKRALEPGARLTEAGVARELGVSKTPVREALLKLREVGLIEPDGVRGNRVVTPSPTALREAYETRRAVESYLAGVAAKSAQSDAVRRIRQAADDSLRGAEGSNREAFRAADAAFHLEIAKAGANGRMQRIIADAMTLIMALRQRDLPDAEAFIDCAQAHVRIASAIEGGAGAVASDEMARHLERVEHYILDDDGGPLG